MLGHVLPLVFTLVVYQINHKYLDAFLYLFNSTLCVFLKTTLTLLLRALKVEIGKFVSKGLLFSQLNDHDNF